MAEADFRRARSTEAKETRVAAILESARSQAQQRSVREVTLTDIAAGTGMHKSAMLRYFETREEIFLRLAAEEWRVWSAAAVGDLEGLGRGHHSASSIAAVLASTLVARPLFCDLLAQTPLNLERGVSMAALKEFKLAALASAKTVATALQRSAALDGNQTRNVVATATSMAGALWQMAAPGTDLRRLYETDPELKHAIVDVQPRLTDVLQALIGGYLSE
jgi:AcrR family transcriptional regulator